MPNNKDNILCICPRCEREHTRVFKYGYDGLIPAKKYCASCLNYVDHQYDGADDLETETGLPLLKDL